MEPQNDIKEGGRSNGTKDVMRCCGLYGLGTFVRIDGPTMLLDICRCSLALFNGIGDTMATTVGRCFDRSAAMRLILDHRRKQINAPEDSSSGLIGTGRAATWLPN